MGALRLTDFDLRQENGPTTYVSAGATDEYKNFIWRIDCEGRLIIDSAPECAKLPVEEKMLSAHRTFKCDIRGNCETYSIITTFKGHESFWKL